MPRSSQTQPSKPRTSESRPRQNNQAQQSKLSPEAKKEAITQAHAWLRTPEGRHASNGKPNFMAAHKKFGIPYNTLRDRVLGLHRAPHEAHAAQMLITPEQEQAMVDWMKKDAEEGHPWTRVRIKLRVADLTGGRIPSNSWIYSFNDRHHDILHFRSTSGLDPVRAQCFNPTTIHEHFKKYGEIQGNYRIKVNFDETGNQLGGGRKNTGRKCYTVRGASSTKYRQRDASLELVTVMEACTSEGVMLDPGFIFSSSSGGWTTEWWEGFEDRPISVGLTNNGWTSDDQCIYWFENVFLPQVKQMRENSDERVLCIFDGHHSHLTDELFDLACANNVDFYLLPAHTTHKCQPLDVGVFSPISKHWALECERVVEETGQKICRDDFVKRYMKIRDESLTPDIIKTAWRKTGLHPFNPAIFTDADFAPSRPYSTQTLLPSSFPIGGSRSYDLEDHRVSGSPVPPPTVVNEHAPLVDEQHQQQPMDLPDSDEIVPEDSEEAHGGEAESTEPTSTRDMSTGAIAELTNSYIPLPGPPIPEFKRTPLKSRELLVRKVEVLSADLDRLEELYNKEFKRSRTAEAHCALALMEIKKLKLRLNAKEIEKQRKTKRFPGSAGQAMMGAEARQQREVLRAEKEQKKQAQEEKENGRVAKNKADSDRRAELASGKIRPEYSGTLRSMRKPELQDIAYLLGIEDYAKLVGDALRSRIKERLLEKSDVYHQDSRFSKLFIAFNREAHTAHPVPRPASQNANNTSLPLPSHLTLPRPPDSMQVDMFPDSLPSAEEKRNVLKPTQTSNSIAVAIPFALDPSLISDLPQPSSSQVTLDNARTTFAPNFYQPPGGLSYNTSHFNLVPLPGITHAPVYNPSNRLP